MRLSATSSLLSLKRTASRARLTSAHSRCGTRKVDAGSCWLGRHLGWLPSFERRRAAHAAAVYACEGVAASRACYRVAPSHVASGRRLAEMVRHLLAALDLGLTSD